MKSLSTKKKILNVFLAIIFLIAVQTLTYSTIGYKQLKNKLLTYPLDETGRHSDSVFVRDFYYNIGDSYDAKTRDSHHLSKDEDFIKSRLNVKYIYFDSEEKFYRKDKTQLVYGLQYETYIERQHWIPLLNFYSVKQYEFLSVRNRLSYDRQTSYRWFFFFWIPTYEWVLLNDCRK